MQITLTINESTSIDIQCHMKLLPVLHNFIPFRQVLLVGLHRFEFIGQVFKFYFY